MIVPLTTNVLMDGDCTNNNWNILSCKLEKGILGEKLRGPNERFLKDYSSFNLTISQLKFFVYLDYYDSFLKMFSFSNIPVKLILRQAAVWSLIHTLF